MFFKKIPKPMGRVLMVSFKIIFVINKVNSKTPGESGHPFKVVQKWPCKISFYFHTMPSHKKQQLECESNIIGSDLS
jgi:hypothetical protein